MKILHIINGLDLGGAETLLYRLVLRGDGIEHAVICLGPEGWYSDRIRAAGVELHHLGLKKIGVLRTVSHLRRLIKSSRADVVQCWLYRSNLLGGLAAKLAGVPCVWGIHCSSIEPLPLSSRLWVYAGGASARFLADQIINCSQRSAKIHAKLGFAAAPVAVIHNGYDADAFSIDQDKRERGRTAFGFQASDFVMATIARWHEQKDIPNLLHALTLVRSKLGAFSCLLVGQGLDDANPDLKRLIRQMDLQSRVMLLGPRSDVADIARVIDVHVLPSRGEAFPNVVAETMLCGTPNAVTSGGDSSLMIGDSGWVVPPSDPAALAVAIVSAHQEWADRPKEWAARRVAARDRIATNFGIEKMVRAYVSVWQDVAGPGRNDAAFERASTMKAE